MTNEDKQDVRKQTSDKGEAPNAEGLSHGTASKDAVPKDTVSKPKEQVEQTKDKAGQPMKETRPKYLRQPYPISAMQADLSKQQIKILVGMMQSIQDGVQEMFERQKRVEGQLLLFPDMEDDHVNIDFRFSDVVDRPDYYENVEKVAQKFVEMVFRYEDKEAGEVTLSHFVDEVTYPSKGSKRDKIRFSFTKKQAEKVFNFTMYSKYMLSVAFQADSKYTARLYMLISSARGYASAHQGVFHWYVSYQELRRMLGCDVKEGNQWVTRSRKLYKHFKADILRVAEKELKALADEGKCDCWFEFVELPEDWKGQPKTLDFVVHLSEMGLLEAQRTQEAHRWHAIRQRMQEEWSLSERECSGLLMPLPDRMADPLAERLEKLSEWMKEHAEEIMDRRKYALKSVGDIVQQLRDEEAAHAQRVREADLFGGEGWGGDGSADTEPQSAQKGTKKGAGGQEPMTPEGVVERWLKVLSLKDYQMYVRGLERSMRVEDAVVKVAVPHEEVRQKLEGWRPMLERACGMRLEVTVG